MDDPQFSVILPTCDRPESLEACLQGLGRLDYPRAAYEVVVVNDGKPLDRRSTLAGLMKGAPLRVVEQDHQGPAAARNTAAGLAAGKYLAFIDDDCVPDPAWLRTLERRLRQEPEALVGGRTVNALSAEAYSDATQLLCDFMMAYYDASAPDRTRFFPTCNLAVGADGFRALGGFDTQFAYAGGEDRDFSDRWHVSGRRSAYEPDAVVYHHHRLGMGGYLAQHFRYGRGALRFHRAKTNREAEHHGTSPRFYLELVLYPMGHRPPLAAATRAALLLAAQAATVAGYCWERAAGRSAAAPTPEKASTTGRTGIR